MKNINNNEKEIWRAHPEIKKIEVSSFGRVRTLDKMVWNGKGTYLKKGRILKQSKSINGYMYVGIKANGKFIKQGIHRLVAQTFISNPDNLPEVNHKDNNPLNNNVSNLEFCTHKYNITYREKYGTPAKECVPKSPVFAVNLSTLEVLHFSSQHEAGRKLEIFQSHINAVIKGRQKKAHGYWFKADDGNGIEADKDKLKSIVDSMIFTRCVFAVNLNTLEVSRFNSQKEASIVLGISQGNINEVTKGKRTKAGGYWFVNDDGHADDAIKRKLHDIKKIYS